MTPRHSMRTTTSSSTCSRNDSDVDDGLDPSTLVVVTDPANGLATVESGQIRFTPTANFAGGDTLTYEISDLAGAQAVATLALTVNAVNDPPVANDDSRVTDEDVAVNIDVLANDVDVDSSLNPASLIVSLAATNGTAVVNRGPSTTHPTRAPTVWTRSSTPSAIPRASVRRRASRRCGRGQRSSRRQRRFSDHR